MRNSIELSDLAKRIRRGIAYGVRICALHNLRNLWNRTRIIQCRQRNGGTSGDFFNYPVVRIVK